VAAGWALSSALLVSGFVPGVPTKAAHAQAAPDLGRLAVIGVPSDWDKVPAGRAVRGLVGTHLPYDELIAELSFPPAHRAGWQITPRKEMDLWVSI